MKKTLIGLAIVMASFTAATSISVATTAHAASPACGDSCMTLTSEAYGPGYVSSVLPARMRFTAPPVIMAPSGPYQDEDFQAMYLGPVSVLYHDGIVSSAVELNWSDDGAYEYVYAPGGKVSSLCLGVGSTAVQGTPVTLEPCGVSARTVWVVMANSWSRVFTPLINGTDTRLFNPFVLTAGSDNGQLTMDQLIVYLGRVPVYGQMWRDFYGAIS
jgi:hypothetical protein